MSQFCDRFIPNFSVIAAPLHEFAKSHSSFYCSSDAQTAFETITQLLISAPVLRAPTSDDSFILEVDASDKVKVHVSKPAVPVMIKPTLLLLPVESSMPLNQSGTL